MNSKNTLSLTDARKKIFLIADDVQKPDTFFFLTKNGKAKAVIMSANEFDSWQETIEIMSDPDLMRQIHEADDDFKKENYVNWEDVKKELGYTLADVSDKKYVSNLPEKRSKKTVKKN